MKLQKSGTKVTRYEAGNGLFFLVEETADEYNAWIGYNGFGIMDFVVGTRKDSVTRPNFLAFLNEEAVAFFLVDHSDELEYSDPQLYAIYADEVGFVRERASVYEQYRAELAEISEACEKEGYPSHGENYDLRAEAIREWYAEQYPEFF